jgi:hypothetical protein
MKRAWGHWEGVFWDEEMSTHIIWTDLDIYADQNTNANPLLLEWLSIFIQDFNLLRRVSLNYQTITMCYITFVSDLSNLISDPRPRP